MVQGLVWTSSSALGTLVHFSTIIGGGSRPISLISMSIFCAAASSVPYTMYRIQSYMKSQRPMCSMYASASA